MSQENSSAVQSLLGGINPAEKRKQFEEVMSSIETLMAKEKELAA
jgi:hypothetical protein